MKSSVTCGHSFCGRCLTQQQLEERFPAGIPEFHLNGDEAVAYSFTARLSTSGLWNDDNEDAREAIFHARDLVRNWYQAWMSGDGWHARYPCPFCNQIFSTRPVKSVSLTNLAIEYRLRFLPDEEIPMPAWDADETWFRYFPALLFQNMGETAIFDNMDIF